MILLKSRLIEHITPEAFNDTYIKTDYSPYAKNQVSRILKNGIDDQAVSREKVEAITIDWATSLDLDDAIWVERTRAWYCVWVHISDVSEAIPAFSPLDIEALHRTTSIYRKEHILDMIPPELSNNILSLDPHGIKNKNQLTLSVKIELDEEARLKNYDFFESDFTNLKRYDYESFSDDYTTQESQHHDRLHLMKEVSDRLRINRVSVWGDLDYRDTGRRVTLWKKTLRHNEQEQSKQIPHNIIESFMVLANNIAGIHLSKYAANTSLYKRHDKLNERSFYNHLPDTLHIGLGVRNYTHFTSPIRRYIDLVIHRIIKSLIRGSGVIYATEDLKFIAKHVNNTRWKIETLWAQMDLNTRGQHFVEKAIKELWRPLEVYDMKEYIRNATHRSLNLPEIMRDSIITKIESWHISSRIWCIGVILLGKDKQLKETLKKRLIEKRPTWPTKIFHVLEDTRILRGWERIFTIEEKDSEKNFSIKILCHGVVVAKSKWALKNYETSSWMRYHCRRKAIENMCDYFINL